MSEDHPHIKLTENPYIQLSYVELLDHAISAFWSHKHLNRTIGDPERIAAVLDECSTFLWRKAQQTELEDRQGVEIAATYLEPPITGDPK